jgi:GT2 family glycosyltransferase
MRLPRVTASLLTRIRKVRGTLAGHRGVPTFATVQDRVRAGAIARTYRLVFRRDPDRAGLEDATKNLLLGSPLARFVADALNSDEFKRSMDPVPETAGDIDRMFRAAFGHEPPALGADARDLPVTRYAAELVLAEERRRPTRATGVMYPDGLDPLDAAAYRHWVADHYLLDEKESDAVRVAAEALPPGVVVSLVLAECAGPARAIAETVRSVRAQLCDRFELIAAGGAAHCARVTRLDPRAIPIVTDARDFATAFNAALPSCRGTFVFAPDPGVRLAPDAVFRVAAAVAAGPDRLPAALFVDHDRLDRDGRRGDPALETGWNPETILCRDDWAPNVMPRTDLARAVGGARADYPGRERDDLVLRAIDAAGDRPVRHVPGPLFTVAAAPARADSWSALVADRLAAAARDTQPPRLAMSAPGEGPWRIIYPLARQPPLVSLIIPTRDKSDLLRACVDGLLHRTDYTALEIVILDNRSEEPRTHAYLAQCAALPNVRVVPFDRDFNWGAINNLGVRESRGDVIVLLNNDIEVEDPDWLTELVAQAMRPEVGAAGAKLLYRDGTVQHAGLLFGPGARSYHRFRHMRGDEPGYRGELAMVREVSAVTGACLAMRRAVFDEVGGIEEQALTVTWSDTDLCFRVRARGYRVICTPFASLVHLELATRGADDTPERIERAERERQVMLARWPVLSGEDPFFNPNLHLGERDTRLASTPRPSPGFSEISNPERSYFVTK